MDIFAVRLNQLLKENKIQQIADNMYNVLMEETKK